MITNVYAMRDSMQGFLQPTFDLNDNLAKRNFTFALTRKDTLLYARKQDFDLFKIGSYDSDTGLLTSITPECILQGASVNED